MDFANSLEHVTTSAPGVATSEKNTKFLFLIDIAVAVFAIVAVGGLLRLNKSQLQQQPVVEKQSVDIKKEKILSGFSKIDAVKLEIEAKNELKVLGNNDYSDFSIEIDNANIQFRIGEEANHLSNYNLACESFIKVTNIFNKLKKSNDKEGGIDNY